VGRVVAGEAKRLVGDVSEGAGIRESECEDVTNVVVSRRRPCSGKRASRRGFRYGNHEELRWGEAADETYVVGGEVGAGAVVPANIDHEANERFVAGARRSAVERDGVCACLPGVAILGVPTLREIDTDLLAGEEVGKGEVGGTREGREGVATPVMVHDGAWPFSEELLFLERVAVRVEASVRVDLDAFGVGVIDAMATLCGCMADEDAGGSARSEVGVGGVLAGVSPC